MIFEIFIYRFKNTLFSNGTDQSSNEKKKVYACLVSSSWIKLSWFYSYELWRPIAIFPWGIVLMLLRWLWWHYKVAWNTVQMSWKLYSETSSKGTYYSQCFLSWLFKMTNVTIMCHNDELSSTISWVGCLLTDLSATRYIKVKRIIGITEILRRIWLFSANKIKISESFSKQPTHRRTQLIIAAKISHNTK